MDMITFNPDGDVNVFTRLNLKEKKKSAKGKVSKDSRLLSLETNSCYCQMSWQSIQKLLRYFSLEPTYQLN